MPAITTEALGHVFAEGQLGVAFDADGVVVVDPAEVVQAQVAGHGRRLAGDTFHHVAVAAKDVDVIVEQGHAWLVEPCGQPLLCQRHADAVATTLPKGTGSSLDSGGHAVFGVTWRLGVQLAELLDVVEADRFLAGGGAVLVDFLHARQVQQRVEQHGGMADRQHEAVTVRPVRVLRVIAEEAAPQRMANWSQGHRGTGVAGVGLLYRVHGQGTDGVDGQLVGVGAGRCGGTHGKRPRAGRHATRDENGLCGP